MIGDIWDIIIIALLIFILAYEINLQLVPNEDVRGEELWWGQRFELTPSWFALSMLFQTTPLTFKGFVSTAGALVVITA